MATSAAKKTAAASSRLTVMPLFVDQHGTVDEDTGEVIECYAEHCGSILLSDQALPGSKRPRTLVSSEDFWKAGWETDENGDPVDPADVDRDEVEKFVIDPFTTTKQHLEEQFGKRYLFAIATWGEGAPEGKNGLMRGSGHSFFTGGDVLKKRGLVVDEKPKKKTAAAPAEDTNEDDEPETPEETIERLEAEAAERDERLEALEAKLEAKLEERAAPQPESPTKQLRETFEVMDSFGMGPRSGNANAGMSQQREQWWQEQLANERQQSANALNNARTASENTINGIRTTAMTELATARTEAATAVSALNGAATAASIRYEAALSKANDDARTTINALNADVLRERESGRKALEDERKTHREELTRREVAHENAINALKTALTAAESRLSTLREATDTKISTLTGDGNVRLLDQMKSDMFLKIEQEKMGVLTARAVDAEKKVENLSKERLEMLEAITVMKQTRPNVDGLIAAAERSDSGFRIPPIVLTMLAPAVPLIIMFVVKWYMDKQKEMPPEVREFFKKWREATGGKGDPGAWAAEQAQNAASRAREEYEERVREQERQDTKQRSWEYEQGQERAKKEGERRDEEKRQAAQNAAAEAAAKAAQAAKAEAERAEAARVEAERAQAEHAEKLRAANAPKPTGDWKPTEANGVPANGAPANEPDGGVMSTAGTG